MPGIPDWIVPTGGIGGILASLIVGFWKGYLWTRPQVEKLLAAKDAYAIEIIAAKDAEIKRLNEERLEWKAFGLESLGVLKQVNPTMDSVLQGQLAIKGLLEALRNKAEAS
jgi:hypothetical protein